MDEYRLLYYFTYAVLILSLLDRVKRLLVRFFLYRLQVRKNKKHKRKSLLSKNKR